MLTKVGEIKGYDIFYDSDRKRFYLRDDAGNDLTSADSQEELEIQAAKISKASHKMPIRS